MICIIIIRGALTKQFNFSLWNWELGGHEKEISVLSDN